MADALYHLACECVCNDGSNRKCKSDVGHFVNGHFVPNKNYYIALERAKHE
jgi:hypothetical protein